MPSFEQTKDLSHFMEVLSARKQEKGDQVGSNFKINCLTKVSPQCSMTKMWITDIEWKFVPEPDGGAPKDPEESLTAIAEEKDKYYRDWSVRIADGDFDSETVPSGGHTVDDGDEEVNMSDLAAEQTEEPQAETSTSTSTSTSEREEESERIANLKVKFEEEQKEKERIAESIKLGEAHDQRLEDEANDEILPSLRDEQGDKLLTYLGLYIRKHSPTQEMVSNAVSDNRLNAMAEVIKTQAEKIKSLEESIPSLVDEHLKSKFN